MNSVKITAGKFKGLKIATPGGKTHPMGERERLALFNMLLEYVPEARVLDAFAGSGALGIEAFSRGADKVVFVEKNGGACRVIRENLAGLGFEAEVFQGDVENFTAPFKLDVILADPPYDNFETEKVAYLCQFLKKGGVLALSHPGEAPELPGVELLKTRKYAGARISVYVKG